MIVSENTHIPITAWAEDDKPREKLLLKGKQALSDAELIAILISTGTKTMSALDLAKKIITLCQSDLNLLGKLTVKELCGIKGIGQAKAITILAALELGLRRKLSAPTALKIVNTSKTAFEIFQAYLSDLQHEEFWIMLLDRRGHVLKVSALSKGGVSGTVVDIKIIIKEASQHMASSLILAHNHPSGNLKPSSQDISITNKIKAACNLVDINLQDHIIVAQNVYFSFADEDMLH